jgi:outer membrane receptor protein involved in Fe transport
MLLLSLLTTAVEGQEAQKNVNNAPTGDNLEEILVTGSRVITNGNDSPTPVTVVPVTQLELTTPSNIADGLNKLPQFSGSLNQTTPGTPGTNNAGNFLDLRGEGIIRTLVLFDGHRVPGTAADGTIDTNMIPQQLIDRVEVVTGGASAVYGSDAVAGVVNYVVDKKFDGVKFGAQGGISTYGDDSSGRFSITAGTDLFAGRGHVEGSYEFYDSAGISSAFARPAGRGLWGTEGAGTAANPYTLVGNTRFSYINSGGLILSGPLAGMTFDKNGVLTPFNPGLPTGTGNIQIGGDGGYQSPSLAASLQTHQFYGRFDYNLTDNISPYIQLSLAQSENNSNYTTPFFTSNLFATNPYLPASAQAAMAAAGVNQFAFFKFDSTNDVAPTTIQARTRNIWVNTGVDGKFGDGYQWDVSYSHGVTDQRVIDGNNVNEEKMFAATDAVVNPANGQIVCDVTLTNPGLYPGCTPLNQFGPSAGSQAALAYISGNTYYTLTNNLDDVTASLTGAPIATWAGPIKMALNAEFRALSLTNESTDQPTTPINCTGLRLCTPGTQVWLLNVVANAHGSENVTEGAYEFDAPLVTDQPLFKSLSLNGAIRYTHYSISGDATTYKIGLIWHATDELTFRGTRSQDIRAPTLFDLFAPVNESIGSLADAHTGIAHALTVETTGNSDLRPEEAQNVTAGIVYRPTWLPRFSMALDYFRVKLTDGIETFGGRSPVAQAQCEASGGTSPFCALIIRPLPFSNHTAANFPTLLINEPINLSDSVIHGFDAEGNYAMNVGAGDLSLRLLVAWEPSAEQTQYPGATPFNTAGTVGVAGTYPAIPKWKVAAFGQYDYQDFAVNALERVRSPLKTNVIPGFVSVESPVEMTAYTDLTLSYTLRSSWSKPQFFLAIENLFNKQPPIFGGAVANTVPGGTYPTTGGDDVIGRYFTLGVKGRF